MSVNANKYKIYTLKDGLREYYGVDASKGDVFEFETDEEMIEKVREMRKTGIPYLWKRVYEISVVDENGKIKETYEDSDEHWEAMREKDNNKSWYKKTWDSICRFWYRTDSKWQEVKWAFERMFKGYDRTVAWSMDSAILKMIKKNVPKMIENLHGCPNSYVVKAIRMLNTDLTETEAMEKQGDIYETNVAVALWENDLGRLVEHCKLVSYYECHGKQETDDENWVDPLTHKIPYKEFSKEIDYSEFEKLVKTNYDWIFDFFKEHFTELWD